MKLRDLGKASHSLSNPERFDIDVMCEAVKETLEAAADELVEKAAGWPMLCSRSCDGTPMQVAKYFARKLPGSGRKVRSIGKSSKEFLVKNEFLRCRLPAEGTQTRIVLKEATSLEYGKSVPAILAPCCAQWKTLRQRGHAGCAVEHYVFDRAGYTALERMTRQMHREAEGSYGELAPHRPARLLPLTEFLVYTPCALHDSQNAFRWAFLEQSGDRDFMRTIYISMESLRNDTATIDKHLGSWIAQRIMFVEPQPFQWEVDQQKIWDALDLDPDISTPLTSLQYRFEGGNVVVSNRWSRRASLVGDLASLLGSCWRFKKWTESRWLGAGTASRVMVVGLLTGIADIVNFILEAGESDWFLKGFKKLQAEHMQFLVQAALSSRVAESFQQELMEDSRLALRYEELIPVISEELSWLCNLDAAVWERLGQLCALSGEHLAHEVIRQGHYSYHFIWRRVLEPAGGHPWSLLRGGDIEGNLEELRSEAPPSEPVARQIWELLHDPDGLVSMTCIVESVRLLGEIGWSSLPAEQQHGSLAVTRRWHPEYSQRTMLGRSLIIQACRLLGNVSKEEKQIATISKKMRALLSKNPDKAVGRQQFLAELCASLRRRREGGDERVKQSPREISQAIMGRHAVLWAARTLREKAIYRERAALRAAEKHEEIVKELRALESERDVLEARLESTSLQGGPLTMSSAAFRDVDLEKIHLLATSPSFRAHDQIERLRAQAMTTCMPLSASRVRELATFRVWEKPDPIMPEWAATLASQREGFRDVALLVPDAEDRQEQVWLLLYFVQKPHVCRHCEVAGVGRCI